MRTGLLTIDSLIPELAPEATARGVPHWAAHGCRALSGEADA
jgi:hypothetical protein